ncbi:uncharacterized protein F5Z01DRAFT_330111 [Emericellopsis atlantica]|uniref:Regulatory P domain-containing protein n=1 Tax=Emericellopsis atlantica TaxID=2614577 RepID=A0A9P8CLI0_9HYPO|nr:uncharacterized protein F5Z01DRAFT_330111 [Emericellopsis atlantica]KAG9251040.1 hypothetical protein F5Z01DRAFT_330111 [Emericellopsis atlantica]
MKASIASIFFAGLATSAAAQSIQAADFKIQASDFKANELKASSAPKAVAMSTLRQRKESQFSKDKAAGMYDMDRYEVTSATECVDGKAGEYSCNNIDLKGFIRHQDTNSRTREGNDLWGWTSSSGREFALLGQSDGTAFVEVNSDGSLTYVGRLPTQTVASSWRDIKVIGNYAYIGSEARDHGMQIFDLRKLEKADKKNPPTYSISKDLTAHFSGFGSSHNLVASEDRDIIAAVGTEASLKCNSGLWFVDVSNPSRPQDAGCLSDDGYVHDAQMVIYNGPDRRYQGKHVSFGFNEDALVISLIDRLTMPSQISRTTYNGATYTHQGWVTEDHKYLLLDDELDEQYMNGPAADQRTTTYVVDITDLSYPVFRGIYKSPSVSIDHNQYIVDGLAYQANYGSGLRVVNVTSLAEDDTGALFEETAFFDVRPEDDAVGGEATFNGAWSVYPYFQSGHIVVSSIERGLFSLKLHEKKKSKCKRQLHV